MVKSMSDIEISLPTFSVPIHEAIFWRGVFIHRYSGVEHSVTELLLRAGARDEYKSLGNVPYPWPKKLQRLKDMIDIPGPLKPYASPIQKMMSAFVTIERHRHVLAHSIMSHDVRKNDNRALYFKSHDWVGGTLGEVILEISIDELIIMTQDLGPISRDFPKLVAKIFREVDLQPIEVSNHQPLESEPRAF